MGTIRAKQQKIMRYYEEDIRITRLREENNQLQGELSFADLKLNMKDYRINDLKKQMKEFNRLPWWKMFYRFDI